MIDVFLIEDEFPAMQRLARLVCEAAPDVRLVGRADSVRGARRWLAEHTLPQIVFADIQLGDGNSIDLFRGPLVACPVVFVTAYDDYLLEAFAAHGIAYLLKPPKPADVARAFAKYRELGRHFAGRLEDFLAKG